MDPCFYISFTGVHYLPEDDHDRPNILESKQNVCKKYTFNIGALLFVLHEKFCKIVAISLDRTRTHPVGPLCVSEVVPSELTLSAMQFLLSAAANKPTVK